MQVVIFELLMSVRHPFLTLAGLYCFMLGPVFGQDPRSTTKFQWGDAIRQSAGFLALEHGIRIAGESDTRAGLKGPFVHGYLKSVGSLHGWSDGDPFPINYVGHPFQGAISGYIQVQNDPRYRRVEFGSSRDYWKSRFRALAWSAAYSTQFEIGPISEASLGNVQMKPGSAGVVDLVVTPAGGFALMIAEDALDRFVVKRVEKWTRRPVPRVLVRGFLNPNRAMANMLRGQVPWSRDNRPGVTVP
jgi:hypothetical protein